MTERIEIEQLQVAGPLWELVNERILPGTGVDQNHFWNGFAGIVSDLAVKNSELLKKRDLIQGQLDQWHQQNSFADNFEGYRQFLESINYLLPEPPDFKVHTQGVDSEISVIAGPQLVVPVMNARYALNAANARWGSLYDALYGTDVISEDNGASRGGEYNPVRGKKVIAYARALLDEAMPLEDGSHGDAVKYVVSDWSLLVRLENGSVTSLKNASQFAGYVGPASEPASILLINNGLHIDIQIDRNSEIGSADLAGIKDLLLESAITTIQDCEDSIAAVDVEDKVLVYENWLGLMKGNLTETVAKGDGAIVRELANDRHYIGQNGEELILPGRSLLLIRNVGHLMTNDAVLYGDGKEIPEGIMDAVITSLIALHDLCKTGHYQNSREGSIYIVKPKMHGPEEVAFCVEIFERVEQLLGLPSNSIKLGIMDEERRTTVNLKACIYEARERIIFINTGFLDRTGDEIHSSMWAGPVVSKEKMKAQPWINAYEDWNVDIGLETGMQGHAQIGKGMWPKPEEMAQMMELKIGHPEAGASCAWVPSPTAATLHVMHYHKVCVAHQQQLIASRQRADLRDILTIPILENPESLSTEAIQRELDNNAQGILGYVVRWIDQGVGCSKVPDINNVALMEDRATLRISSQHIANWLHHGICSDSQVLETMQRMAGVVDRQNEGDLAYQNMAPAFADSIAFQAACDLVFKGKEQPNGYTEPVLHQRRKEAKNKV